MTNKVRILFATLVTALMFGVAAPAAHATYIAPPYPLGVNQEAVWSLYNNDCGGSNPWHASGNFWWCTNRLVEMQTLSHTAYYRTADISYCYTEAKIGAKKERCLEARTYWNGTGKAVVTNLLAYWTNAG